MSVLLDRYRDQRARVANRAAAGIRTTWDRLPTYDDPSLFVPTAVTISRGAQQAVAQLTEAYLALQIADYSGQPAKPVGVNVGNVLGRVRNGVPLEDVYARPFTTLRVALAAGAEWQDALSRGGFRAEQAVRTDVTLAARETTRETLPREPHVYGYRRVLSGSGCALCEAAADEVYGTDDVMPIHPTCECGFEPLVRGDEDSEPPPPDEPADLPEIKVVEHGELGALLWDAGQHFDEL